MNLFSNNNDLEEHIKNLEESVNSIMNVLKLKKCEGGISMSREDMVSSYFASNEGDRVCVVTGTTANNYPIEPKVLYNAVIKCVDRYSVIQNCVSPESFCELFPRLTTKDEYEGMLVKAFEYLKG